MNMTSPMSIRLVFTNIAETMVLALRGNQEEIVEVTYIIGPTIPPLLYQQSVYMDRSATDGAKCP